MHDRTTGIAYTCHIAVLLAAGSTSFASDPDEPLRQGYLSGGAGGTRWRRGQRCTQSDGMPSNESEATDIDFHASYESGPSAEEGHGRVGHVEGQRDVQTVEYTNDR